MARKARFKLGLRGVKKACEKCGKMVTGPQGMSAHMRAHGIEDQEQGGRVRPTVLTVLSMDGYLVMKVYKAGAIVVRDGQYLHYDSLSDAITDNELPPAQR